MLDFTLFSAYLGAVITLIITPGPVVALVLKNTLKGQDSKTKSTQALKTICGTNLGSLLLIAVSIAVILGVAKVSETMLGIMSIVGCGFILYLGSSSLLGFFKQRKCGDSAQPCHIERSEISYKDSKFESNQSEDSLEKTTQNKYSPFLQGLLLSLSNPKDILFFIAFFPQFLGITHSLYLSIAVLTLSWIALDFSLLLLISYISQKIQLKRFETLIAPLSDIVLIMVGIFGIVYGVISLQN
ncbi:LysE family translocator [Helicobacter magdeburgensis]|uniref:LysE family translocator n=1 Tax=Helicobacter magdeburgensis TaxID=471858 RepID=A0A4U8T125_9HELI|nr:LysE family translocator [Helicobacter magdeburgensis]TLD93119.1 LysE family translocator [Helicobacter magdeburgensis]